MIRFATRISFPRNPNTNIITILVNNRLLRLVGNGKPDLIHPTKISFRNLSATLFFKYEYSLAKQKRDLFMLQYL